VNVGAGIIFFVDKDRARAAVGVKPRLLLFVPTGCILAVVIFLKYTNYKFEQA